MKKLKLPMCSAPSVAYNNITIRNVIYKYIQIPRVYKYPNICVFLRTKQVVISIY